MSDDRFWKKAKLRKVGFKWTPLLLQKSIIEYFDWAHDNPLAEAKPFAYKGDSWIEEVSKARSFTKHGLCNFIGISLGEWDSMANDPDLSPVKDWADQIIYQQKFELAATDLLNAGFIARDLGLSDRKEVGGIAGQPLEVSARDQLLDRIAGIAASIGASSTPDGADGS